MDGLPVELLRLIFGYCDRPSVRNLREANRTLATIGYEYMLSPRFTVLGYRNDIDRLRNIALHPQLRATIDSVVINLSDVDDYDARHAAWLQHFVQLPEERQLTLSSAWTEYPKIAENRKMLNQFHTRADDLREAFVGLPNLKEVMVTFTECPVDNEVLRDVYGVPSCRRMDRTMGYNNLNTIIAALHGLPLSSLSIDWFPLEILKIPNNRRHWFTHSRSLTTLTRLDLTLDPSGLQGPASAMKAVNGLGYVLQQPTQLRNLRLAFHPYSSPDSKFALSFRELLNGFVYPELTDLTLVGMSCEEGDLKNFIAQHQSTLRRLRLGGRGLAKPYQASLGGMHIREGTLKSLFVGLRAKLAELERLHLEGIFECEGQYETYNFYPLTNEDWEEVPRPTWVHSSRETISCLPFEQFLTSGGPYPGYAFGQQNN
ncbi:putative F-box domain-containing protein [Seiridium cardinale]